MWWIFGVLLVVVIVVAVVLAVIVVRARKHATVKKADLAASQAVQEDRAASALLMRELRPAFAQSVQRLRSIVGGIDSSYGVPWYLLIGPAGAGKTTLLSGAIETAIPSTRGTTDTTNANGLTWSFFEGGVVIDVAATLAFPDNRRDLSGWNALLRLIKRYRPRRPIDGVIVAVPATLLVDDAWKGRVQTMSAAIRERLALAQAAFGFSLPVYVVITQADQIRGFSAFTSALPDHLQQDMLGWSNPHAADLVFQSSWIAEGILELHRGIVHMQVELFAGRPHIEQASDFFLFSGEVKRISEPLRILLEEIFRPTAYQAGFSCRGFYLCGQATAGDDAVDLGGRVAPPSIKFLGDLLSRKIFPERGLAAPLPGTSVARDRVSVAAQVAAVLIAIVLAVGTNWTYARLSHARDVQERFFRDVNENLELRAQSLSNQRSMTDEERISRGFQLLEGVERLSVEDFHSIFFPASIIRPIEPQVAIVLRETFGHLILPDFRLALERKGQDLFAWNGEAPVVEDEDDTIRPVLDASPHYRAMQRFANEYRTFVDNYFRYHALSLVGSQEGDLRALADLGNYLTGRQIVAMNVPEEPYGRALREAVADPVDCRFALDRQLQNLVKQRGAVLLNRFGTSWFGDENPLLRSETEFEEEWKGMVETGDADIRLLIDQLDGLAASAATWAAIGGRSGDLRIPVLDQAPFKRLDSKDLCAPLSPELAGEIETLKRLRDELTGRLVKVAAEPFDTFLEQGDKGLRLSEPLQVLKTDLDELKAKDFWVAIPVSSEGVLPQRATWRAETIDQTTLLFDAYDRYRSGAFPGFEPAFRRPLVTALTAEVARGLATRLSFDATEGAPLPTSSAELLAEVSRLGGVLTKMSRLVPLFESSSDPFVRELVTNLDGQAAEALRRLETDAVDRHPYVFDRQSDFVFNSWAEIRGEAAAPADALKKWAGFVEDERSSVRQYAAQAEPLVRFLTATRAASPLSRRWSAIVEDVARNTQNLAGNGFGTFEVFVRDGIPAIVPEKDCVPAGMGPAGRNAGGFFLTLRNDLAERAVRHCREMATTSVQTRFATIASSFNRLLAGRFPFSGTLDNSREALPADALEFLRVYDRQDGRQLLQQIQARSCSEDATTFLRRIDGLYPLLSPGRELAVPALTLDVLPRFRANPEGEIGGNQIVDWQMDIGRQTFRDSDPEGAKTARWNSGDPVRVVLRFAKDSPDRPLPGTATRVDNRTLFYDYQGVWALFGLLRATRPNPLDLAGARDLEPNLLKFDIPIERDPAQPPLAAPEPPTSRFRVFVRLRVSQPGKPDPLAAPEFPAVAPAQLSCTARISEF